MERSSTSKTKEGEKVELKEASGSEEEDFMSDKFIHKAVASDQQLLRQKAEFDYFNTKKKNTEKVKEASQRVEEVDRRPRSVKQRMFENLQKGLETEISKENKGYQMLMKLGYSKEEGVGKTQAGHKTPLEVVMKSNKHGVDYQSMARGKKHIQQKYSEELASTYVNIKKREFLVKKMKRKLGEIIKYMERQKESHDEDDIELTNVLTYYINEEVLISGDQPQKKVGEKRRPTESECDQVTLETLIEALGEMRVYLREKYNYCIQCKVKNINEHPCKHCE